MLDWTVDLSRDAKKQYKKLEKSGLTRPSIIDVIDLLVMDHSKATIFIVICVRENQHLWPAYEVINKKTKIIEVYYVGSHESAPY